MPTVPASTPASANAARNTSACASNDGVAIFGVRPSWLAAVPRTTATIRSPSRSASGNRLSKTTAQPSDRTNPSAATSNERQWPVGRACQRRRRRGDHGTSSRCAAGQGEVALAVIQAATGQVHVSRPVEHAVSTVIAGPCSPDQYAMRPDAMLNGVPVKPYASEARPPPWYYAGSRRETTPRRRPSMTPTATPDQTGMFDRLPGRLQQQAVLRIHRGRLAFAETEERGVEAQTSSRNPPHRDHRLTGHALLGVVKLRRRPSRSAGISVTRSSPRCNDLPQLLRRIDAAGEPATHSDHCNGSDRCVAQAAYLFFSWEPRPRRHAHDRHPGNP